MLGEEVAHQPDDDRHVDRDVGDDQRRAGVEQAQLLEHDVDRDHDRDRRQDALRDHPEGDVVVAERAPEAAAEAEQQQREDARAPQASATGHRHAQRGHGDDRQDDAERRSRGWRRRAGGR